IQLLASLHEFSVRKPTATVPSQGHLIHMGTDPRTKEYLLLSDFDQTLSFNDSGIALSELIGVTGFRERIQGLSNIHMVQQGGELAYLLLHDPEYRRVRREHLVEVGKRIRLKQNIGLLFELLQDIEGHRFSFYVVSAAPEEVIQSALEGIIPADRIHGTRFRYDEETGEIRSIDSVPAGYGKVAVLDRLRERLNIGRERVVYVGDGISDVHVMLHVSRMDGLTIAVSENKYLTQIARRTILSDNAISVLVPILEDIVGWDSSRIHAFFEGHGFVLRLPLETAHLDVSASRTSDRRKLCRALSAASLAALITSSSPGRVNSGPDYASARPRLFRSSSTVTARIITPPIIACCRYGDMPNRSLPFESRPMINAPISVPMTLPSPPCRLPPPMTTAAMACSS